MYLSKISIFTHIHILKHDIMGLSMTSEIVYEERKGRRKKLKAIADNQMKKGVDLTSLDQKIECGFEWNVFNVNFTGVTIYMFVCLIHSHFHTYILHTLHGISAGLLCDSFFLASFLCVLVSSLFRS